MYKNKIIAVIIPCYNENQFIKNVIDSIPDYVDFIIPVDDCSTDDTYNILKIIQSNKIRVLQTDENSGVGGATKLGISEAIKLDADIIVKIDGDGQMPILT